MESRRKFLQTILAGAGMMLVSPMANHASPVSPQRIKNPGTTVYRAIHGSPHDNLMKVVEMLGGIENLVGSEDIVLIKPNVQWWSQGAPNLCALKSFVDLIMNRTGGFKGEVVIAENCHRGASPWKSAHSGWSSSFQRNADLPNTSNVNDLCSQLKATYGTRFSTVHWIDVQVGAKRIFSPSDGVGYVYCDGTGGIPLLQCDNGASGSLRRSTIMTYPIFQTDKGTIVDFKNGIWKKGSYTGQPLRFINFAALNHHSTFCGATSAIKNYMGITDLSGGGDPSKGGRLCADHYNFHSFAFNWSSPGPVPGMLGKEIASFMKTVRKADLNIVTAEWTGLSSRTDPPVAHTQVVAACTDPVALDYHTTKYILYPNSKLAIHNPDDKKSPVYQYLKRCADEGGGVFDESQVGIQSYDVKSKQTQPDNVLIVKGNTTWGNSLKPLAKYFLLRYFNGVLQLIS